MPFKWSLFQRAAAQWSDHDAPRLGAALAYYTVLSLAPVLVLAVAVSSRLFGADAARGQLYWQIKDAVGNDGARAIQTLLKSANKPSQSTVASIVGFCVLLISSSGVFMELRDMLNLVWDAPKPTGGIWSLLRKQFFSFAMVLGLEFLLIVSLAAGAIIQAAGTFASHHISMPAPVLESINFTIIFIASTLLFALIYKLIPDVAIEWGDVGIGAVVTAVLFAVGKFALGLYLRKAGVGSAYGAAGSVIVLLVWVYYSAQILIFGAEFTHVYAGYRDSLAASRSVKTYGSLQAGHS
jgi:membrane protein